tara:strand:+ start:85 stop:1422 length:1338 start_codon:yes stop_codon:yes gene_type:complete
MEGISMPDSYKVVFSGARVAGVEESELRAELLRLGFDERQVQALLMGRKVTIKSNLSAEQAERYCQRLQSAGLITKVQAESVAEQSVITDEPASRPEPVMSADEPPPPPVASGQGAGASGRRSVKIRFTGTGEEYFGIWIVNIMLLVVTLGFYAPWAKVRNMQYFYGHTLLEDTSFQYLADPWVIFRGRMVALVAVIIWSVASTFYPVIAMGLLLIFIPLIPWIIARSLKFHAVNSAYRNIRFDFVGSYWQAAKVIYLWPILSILSLGLLVPFSAQRWYVFLVDNLRYGRSEFHLNLTAGQVYMFFLKMLGVLLGVAALSAIAQFVHGAFSVIFIVLGYLLLFGYAMAGVTNLIMSATTLADHGFESSLGKRRIVWIFFSNSLLIMLSMGIFTPWAKVRMARYRASCTKMHIQGDLDGFVAGEAQRAGAVGLELGDAFDVGISLI